MKIKIYTCYHTPCEIVSDSVFIPIHVGRSLSDFCLDTIGDDTGENISEKNPYFCELTAQFWAWKNDKDSDWIGIVHYRRYFDFCRNENKINIFGCIETDRLLFDDRIRYGIFDKNVISLIKQNPKAVAVLPIKWDVSSIGYKNIFDHYVNSDHHFKKDIITVREIISKKYPEYIATFDSVFEDSHCCFNNMFVLRRDYFEDYSKWVFDILFEAEKLIDTTYYSKSAKRVFGYISERLLNVYIKKNIQAMNKSIVELNRIMIKNMDMVKRKIKPISDNSVAVVTASDDNFVPHLAAMLMSIQLNLNKDKQLDFIILDGGISLLNRRLLEKQFYDNGKGRITLINCMDSFNDLTVHMHFAQPTFYRLSLGKILPDYNKIIYLDSDIIVLGDLSELYDIQLDDNEVLAAVTDIVMKHFVATGAPSIYSAGGLKAKQYLMEWVGLGDNYDDYFQAGVLLIDLNKYNMKEVHRKSIDALKGKKYWFLDQDVLNKILLGSVKYIDLQWNVLNESFNAMRGLDEDLKKSIKEAFESPRIIHYAGKEAKPWINNDTPMSEFYWYYLRQTIWYEKVRDKSFILSQTGIIKLYKKFKNRVLFFLMISWRKLPNRLQKKLFWLRNIIVED